MSVLYAGAVGAAIYNSWPAHPASFTGHRTLPRQLVIEIKQTWPHKLSGNWHAKMINFADAYLKWSWRLRPDFAQNKQTVSLNCNWARLQSKKKKRNLPICNQHKRTINQWGESPLWYPAADSLYSVFNLPQLWANYLPHFTFISHFGQKVNCLPIFFAARFLPPSCTQLKQR